MPIPRTPQTRSPFLSDPPIALGTPSQNPLDHDRKPWRHHQDSGYLSSPRLRRSYGSYGSSLDPVPLYSGHYDPLPRQPSSFTSSSSEDDSDLFEEEEPLARTDHYDADTSFHSLDSSVDTFASPMTRPAPSEYTMSDDAHVLDDEQNGTHYEMHEFDDAEPPMVLYDDHPSPQPLSAPQSVVAWAREHIVTTFAYGACLIFILLRELLIVFITGFSLAVLHPLYTGRFSRLLSTVLFLVAVASVYQYACSPRTEPLSGYYHLAQDWVSALTKQEASSQALEGQLAHLESLLGVLERDVHQMKAPHQEMVEAFATRLHDLQDQVARDTSKQLDQQLTTLQQAMQASHAQLQAENGANPSKEASLKEDVSRFAHDWLEQQFASGLLVDRAGVQAAVLQMMQQQQQQQPLEGDWQQKVRQWVQDALYKYHNDGTDADYALHSRGARIMDEWTSPTHNLGKGMRMRAWYWLAGHLVDPTTAIRPATHVGHCWPMEGSNGAIGIRLAQPIAVESISIDHPAAAHLPSSPRDLEVWGVRKAKGNDMHNLYGYNNKKNDHALLNNLQNNPNMLFLGNISHDPKLAIQNHDIAPRYTLPNPTKTAMDGIVLRVINNHGHNDYTCLYRVRVHGNP